MDKKRLGSTAISAGLPGMVVIVMIMIIFGVYVGFTFTNTNTFKPVLVPSTAVSESSTRSETNATSAVFQIPTPSGSDTDTSLAISLQLSLAPSNGSLGEIVIREDLLNVLNTRNNVSAKQDWLYSPNYLNPFDPCGPPGPLGFAVFQGYYDRSNYSSATALTLYNSSIPFFCTTNIFPITYYLFNASSDVASSYTSNGPQYPSGEGFPLAVSYSTGGYWTGGYFQSSSEFHYFPRGTYTVIATDEWGQLVILHFDVVSPVITWPVTTVTVNPSTYSTCTSVTTTFVNYTSTETVTECRVLQS